MKIHKIASAFQGNLWKCMEFHENPMGLYGITWNLMRIPWNLMGIHRDPTGFYGIQMDYKELNKCNALQTTSPFYINELPIAHSQVFSDNNFSSIGSLTAGVISSLTSGYLTFLNLIL